MSMKDSILRLIDNNIAGAQENACRARQQFSQMTLEQIDKEYGKSGRKCRDIFIDYEDALKKANDMKTWFLFFHDCPKGM